MKNQKSTESKINKIVKSIGVIPDILVFPTALDAKKVYQEIDLIEWANKRILESKGNWENENYHEGYKDAMNDLIRVLSNPSFGRTYLA